MSDAPEKKQHAQPEARRESLFRWIMIGGFGSAMLVYFVVHVFDTPMQSESYVNSYSTSPGGHRAFVELMAEQGREIRRQAGRIELPEWNYSDGDTLVMLEPSPRFVTEYNDEFTGVFDQALEGNASVVISMPKRQYETGEDRSGKTDDVVLYEDLYTEADVGSVLSETGFGRWFGIERAGPAEITWQPEYSEPITFNNAEPTQVLVPRGGESALPDEMEVLARTDDGAPVIVRYQYDYGEDRGGVILISDPDFLTNRFIGRPGAASVIEGLISYAPPDGAIVINEDVHGFAADASLAYLAFTPPGLWVTLSVALLLLIFGWRQATVLRPQHAEPQDRRARKYAIEGLARMMERARDHHTAYRRILKRSRLVLGTGHSQVMGAGSSGGTGMMRKGRTGRLSRLPGGTDEERLVNAAQRVSHRMRTGETEHSEWQFDQGQK